MDTLLQSQVFFFISSIGFVTLWIMVSILLYYIIRASSIFYRIMEKVEGDVDNIGDTTKEMLDEMRNSAIFNFIFKKKKKQRKNPKSVSIEK